MINRFLKLYSNIEHFKPFFLQRDFDIKQDYVYCEQKKKVKEKKIITVNIVKEIENLIKLSNIALILEKVKIKPSDLKKFYKENLKNVD
ncbi:MAG: hypothetical protein Q8P20_01080 [bacterium]|nr:hypothetical protein [bacterium]